MSTPGAVLAVVEKQKEKRRIANELLEKKRQERIQAEIERILAVEEAKKQREAWLKLKKAFTDGNDNIAAKNAEFVNIEQLAAVWEDGYTALHSAAAQGLTKCCQTLLSREDFLPSMLHQRDPRGFTPLHCAVVSVDNSAEICELLAGHEYCNLKLTDNEGRTPKDLAQEWAMPEAKTAIMEATARRYANSSAVLEARKEHDIEEKVRAPSKINMNDKAVFNPEAGFKLFKKGRYADVVWIVKSPWPFINQLDDEDNRYRTLLHHAAHRGEPAVCEAILDREDFASCDKFDMDRTTALHLATANRHVECVIAIIASGRCEGVNLQDMRDQTPLHLAAIRCDGECYNAIMAHDEIDLGIRDYQNKLAAEYAIDRGLECDMPIIEKVNEHDREIDDPDLQVDL